MTNKVLFASSLTIATGFEFLPTVKVVPLNVAVSPLAFAQAVNLACQQSLNDTIYSFVFLLLISLDGNEKKVMYQDDTPPIWNI